jgi:hypothetical protein
VDGTDVLNGNQIVVNPNSMLELFGFMDGNMVKNKFKFIKRLKEIEEYRGTNIDDSMIRVEFQYEKPQNVYNYVYVPYIWYGYPYPYLNSPVTYTTTWGGTNTIGGSITSPLSQSNGNAQSVYASNSTLPVQDFNDKGITVKGNQIEQNFHPTFIGSVENESYVLILRLMGYDKEKEDKPIFVSDKLVCSTCGLKSKNTDKFCSRCGSFLE